MESDSNYKIFISYKRDDKEKVIKIKDLIEKEIGLKCWIDVDGIESDAQFANVIIGAINKAQVLLFMYSRSHTKIEDYENDWTIREINFAQKKHKRIVFVNLDGSPLTDWFELFFGTKQQVYYSSDIAMRNLISDLKKWLKVEVNAIGSEDEGLRIQDKNDRSDIGKSQTTKEVSATLSSMLTNQKTNVLVDAENDDSDSQFFIGWQYSQGIDGVMNYFKAVEWWKKAANNGNAKATFELGNCYEVGLGGLPKSLGMAFVYWQKAIDLGYDDKNKLGKVYYKMGFYYKQGIGVQQDSNEAVNYWEKAVELGNSDAMYKLALCYKYGKGVEQDVSKAKSLLQMASELGNNDAMNALKRM